MASAHKLDLKKIVLLLLLIVAAAFAGIVVIDFVGRLVGINVSIPGIDSLKSSALRKQIKKSEDLFLLEREELGKQEERIKLLEEKVINRENEINSKEIDVNKKLEALVERGKELDKKARLLDDRDNQYSDTEKNIREQALKLYNMPPADAVKLIEKQDETDIVAILRAIDKYSEEIGSNSTAPYLLKLLGDLNKDKAANVLRKLKYVDVENNNGVETLDETNPANFPPNP